MGDNSIPDPMEEKTTIAVLEAELQRTPEGDSDRAFIHYRLWEAYIGRFRQLGGIADIDKSITHALGALNLIPEGHDYRSRMLINLGNSYSARFQSFGKLEDIDQAIDYHRQAAAVVLESQPENWNYLCSLAESYMLRFGQTSQIHDINQELYYRSVGMALIPKGHPNRLMWINKLGNAYRRRFDRLGKLADIDEAIRYHTEAVHVDPQLLGNLAHSHKRRFEHVLEPQDISLAIQYLHQSLASLPESDTEEQAARLGRLGVSYETRFNHTGDLGDIGSAIKYQEQSLELVSDEHPFKPVLLSYLASSYNSRANRFGDFSDIDKAIGYLEKALSLASRLSGENMDYLNSLGCSYLKRFGHSGQRADIDQAIKFQTQATSIAPDHCPDKPSWLSNLGTAYQLRFKHFGESADIEAAIEKAHQSADLTPDQHPTMPALLDNLGASYRVRFESYGAMEDINRAIEFQTRATSAARDRPVSPGNLGVSYLSRFDRLGQLEDIDRAIELQLKGLSFLLGGMLSKSNAFNTLGCSFQRRFERLGELKDICNAVDYQRRAIDAAPDEHINGSELMSNLGCSYLQKFIHLGLLDDIDQAIDCHRRAVQLAPNGHAERPARLNNLGNSHQSYFEHLHDIGELDKAIECHSEAAMLTPNTHMLKPARLGNLGKSYLLRYDHLGMDEDIKNAIHCNKQALQITPDGHADRLRWLTNLANAHATLFMKTGSSDALTESMNYYRMAANSTSGSPFSRLKSCRRWAQLASQFHKSSSLEAYRLAMGLVPQVVWLGAPAHRRYEILESIGGLSSEAAATAIELKEYSLALEWLEEGRSVVWSQTMQLRTLFDDLAAIDSSLANRLKQISQELDHLARPGIVNEASMSMQISSEQMAQQHRSLAMEWERLIEEARKINGFGNFMKPKTVEELVPATISRTVVVVNVHKTRCDALVLPVNSSKLDHVPLVSFSYQKCRHLKSMLDSSLKEADVPTRNNRQPVFRPPKDRAHFQEILLALWTDVAEPVLSRLGYLNLPPQDSLPHVVWCPTGPLVFLPLHAAGCYGEPGLRAFDCVISSYTPSISAIAGYSQTMLSGKPDGILAVGQSATVGSTPLPETKTELDHIQTLANGLRFKRLDGINATPSAVLNAMEDHNWVHFACHASQDISDPIESGFHLHDGILSISKIIYKAHKSASFAFLSACQTATGDSRLPDEAIHLAAGMIIAGYPSVVATMWSIKDEDAPLVTKTLYESMLSGPNPGSHKAALALHAAAWRLRSKVGIQKFERWVPYIHMGY